MKTLFTFPKVIENFSLIVRVFRRNIENFWPFLEKLYGNILSIFFLQIMQIEDFKIVFWGLFHIIIIWLFISRLTDLMRNLKKFLVIAEHLREVENYVQFCWRTYSSLWEMDGEISFRSECNSLSDVENFKELFVS